MDKEKILADFADKAIDMYGKNGKLMIADAHNILSSILATLPSEKEIMKGILFEMMEEKELLHTDNICLGKAFDYLDATNSKEEG